MMENKKVNDLTGSVIHIVTPECAVNYKWEKNEEKLPRNLQIISIDDIVSLPQSARNKIALPDLDVGCVLIYDPIGEVYVSAEDAYDKLIESKHNAIMHIASLLGARSASVEILSCEYKIRELDIEGGLGCKFVKANASYSERERERISKKYRHKKVFEGNSSLIGFQEAKAYCDKFNLLNDSNIKQLLRDRDPSHPNKLKKEEYEFELSKECNHSMEAAFKLNILGNVFSLSAGVREAISQSLTLSIKSALEF